MNDRQLRICVSDLKQSYYTRIINVTELYYGEFPAGPRVYRPWIMYRIKNDEGRVLLTIWTHSGTSYTALDIDRVYFEDKRLCHNGAWHVIFYTQPFSVESSVWWWRSSQLKMLIPCICRLSNRVPIILANVPVFEILFAVIFSDVK